MGTLKFIQLSPHNFYVGWNEQRFYMEIFLSLIIIKPNRVCMIHEVFLFCFYLQEFCYQEFYQSNYRKFFRFFFLFFVPTTQLSVSIYRVILLFQLSRSFVFLYINQSHLISFWPCPPRTKSLLGILLELHSIQYTSVRRELTY